MPRHPRILAALLLALAFCATSRADDTGLDGSVETPAVPPAADTGPDAAPGAEPDGSDDSYAPPPRAVEAPKPSPRFNLDERLRFRRWLTSLCRQSPVSPGFAERVRFSRDRPPSVTQPGNKQGSLLLMLQNYAELAQFRDDCEARRSKDPSACRQSGRLPKPWDVKDQSGRNAWLAFGSRAFWSEVNRNRTPAGLPAKTDLLAASQAQLKTLQNALKKDFFELRDAADLDGKPGSGSTARRVAEAVRSESTCGTRAVVDGPERAPSSQK